MILANLRQEKPDCANLISTVRDLAVTVGRQNLFRQVGPGDPLPMMNRKATDVRTELENLEVALSERDVKKSLELAEAALRFL
jgi:hypothetical protein